MQVYYVAIYKAHLVNHHDRFAVAVLQGDSGVGCIPQESSRVAWYFLSHGGEITCEITGRQRSDVDGIGQEVPGVYTSLGKPRNCLS